MQLTQSQETLISYDEMLTLLRQYRPMKKRAIELRNMLEESPKVVPLRVKAGSAFTFASDLYDRFAHMAEQTTEARKAELQSLSYITNRIERVILQLDPTQKDIVSALFVEGITYDEASARYHIARSTVSRRVQKSIRDMYVYFY